MASTALERGLTCGATLALDLSCARCKALVLDPIAAPCGDVQCASCFQDWLSRPGPCDLVKCPTCCRVFEAPALRLTGVCTALQVLLEKFFPAAIAARRQMKQKGDSAPLSRSSGVGRTSPDLSPDMLGFLEAASQVEVSDESCYNHAGASHTTPCQARTNADHPKTDLCNILQKRACSAPSDVRQCHELERPFKRATSDSTHMPAQVLPSNNASASWPGADNVVVGMPLLEFTAAWATAVAAGFQGDTAAALTANTACQGLPCQPYGVTLPPRTSMPMALHNVGRDADGGSCLSAALPTSQAWHSVEDTACRVMVARALLVLLRTRGLLRSSSERVALRAVQHMELTMYRSASSLSEYRNASTLEYRALELLKSKAQEKRRAAATMSALSPQVSAT